VALDAIERRSGPLAGSEVLVVGAGRMGQLAVRAVIARDASVAVANRSADRAEALANSAGGRIEAFDPGPPVADFAAIVIALGGPWKISRKTVDALIDARCVVVDLSVPAAIPPALASRLGTRLITADELALAPHMPLSDPAARRVDALIEATTTEFLAWLEQHESRAAAAVLAERVDHARETELAALWRALPDLDPEQRAAIEGMTRHFAERLLREPLQRLGDDRDGRAERAVREVFAL
jgi:glutamyl-tRNA reductase